MQLSNDSSVKKIWKWKKEEEEREEDEREEKDEEENQWSLILFLKVPSTRH